MFRLRPSPPEQRDDILAKARQNSFTNLEEAIRFVNRKYQRGEEFFLLTGEEKTYWAVNRKIAKQLQAFGYKLVFDY